MNLIVTPLTTSGTFHSICRVLFHPSLMVLFRYRSPSRYLALGETYHLDSGCKYQTTLLREGKTRMENITRAVPWFNHDIYECLFFFFPQGPLL